MITGSFAISMVVVVQNLIKLKSLEIKLKCIHAFAFQQNSLHQPLRGGKICGDLPYVAKFPSLAPSSFSSEN